MINEKFLNTSWPKGLPFHSINYLIIMQSHLSSLPEVESKRIREANKLRALNLAYNEFTDIPGNLPPSLEILRMSHNNIKYITTRHWSTMTNLQKLDLSSNKLMSVPMKLPTTMKQIELQSNLIRYSDPQAFIHLKNLVWLNLENNRSVRMSEGA